VSYACLSTIPPPGKISSGNFGALPTLPKIWITWITLLSLYFNNGGTKESLWALTPLRGLWNRKTKQPSEAATSPPPSTPASSEKRWPTSSTGAFGWPCPTVGCATSKNFSCPQPQSRMSVAAGHDSYAATPGPGAGDPSTIKPSTTLRPKPCNSAELSTASSTGCGARPKFGPARLAKHGTSSGLYRALLRALGFL